MAPFFLLIPIVAFALDALVRGLVPTTIQGIGALIVLGRLVVRQQFGKARPAPTVSP